MYAVEHTTHSYCSAFSCYSLSKYDSYLGRRKEKDSERERSPGKESLQSLRQVEEAARQQQVQVKSGQKDAPHSASARPSARPTLARGKGPGNGLQGAREELLSLRYNSWYSPHAALVQSNATSRGIII